MGLFFSSRPAANAQPFAAFDLEAARGYDAYYDSPAGRTMVAAEEALCARLLGTLPATRSVLEVGCGTGHFARWFAGRGLQVVGLDAAPAMLAVARERGGGPIYAEGSAEQLPFPDGSHDLVAFVTSLEFVGDPSTALREAARVARAGLLLGVINLASPLGIWRRIQTLHCPSPYRGARFHTPWGLARLARRALGRRVCSVAWDTAVFPAWLPGPLRRLPIGGFIGLAVAFRPAAEDGRPRDK